MKPSIHLATVILSAACLAPSIPGRTCAAASEAGHLATVLRERGVTGVPAGRIQDAFASGAAEGLPVETLNTRLLEGLAKGVQPDALAAAIEARLNSLRTANAMIRASGYENPSEPAHGELLASTARAVESGVDAADLGAVLRRGRGESGGRMQTVVESGESLALSGVDAATVRSFMNDCLDRNLRRMEILRAARFSIQQHRGGMSGTDIRRTLWGGDAAQGQPLRGQGSGHGNGRGGPGGASMGPAGSPSGVQAGPRGSAGGAGAGSTAVGVPTGAGGAPSSAESPGGNAPGGKGPGGAGGGKP